MNPKDGPHDSTHEAWIAELIAGERSTNDPSVSERLRECATCRADFEALRSLGAALDADADFDARVIEQAEKGDIAPRDRAAFERAREAQLSTAVGAPSPSANSSATPHLRLVWVRVAVVAALVLIGVWFKRPSTGVSPLTDGQLSGEYVLRPCGVIDGANTFVIEGELSKGWKYSFRVCPIDDGGNMLEPILRSPAWLSTPRWELDAAQAGALPKRFRWFVDIQDSRQNLVKTLTCDVELRSR